MSERGPIRIWRRLCTAALLCVAACLPARLAGEPLPFPKQLPADIPEQRTQEYQNGVERFLAGEYKAAANDFKQVAAQAAEPAVKWQGQIAMGFARLQADRLKEAEKIALEILNQPSLPFAIRAFAVLLRGEALWRNGASDRAVEVWSAPLADFSEALPPAARPLVERLAEAEGRRGRDSHAARWLRKLVPLQRKAVPERVQDTLHALLRHHVRTNPDAEQLADLYQNLRGFGQSPRDDTPEAPPTDQTFWHRMLRLIRTYGDFTDAQRDEERRYYRYWAEAMGERFPSWDDFHIARATFYRRGGEDTQTWLKRLDRQFFDHGKPTADRFIRWIRLYKDNPDHLEAFLETASPTTLPEEQSLRVVQALFEYKSTQGVARRTLSRIDLDRLDENAKLELARFLWHRAPDVGRGVCSAIEDRNKASLELLRFFHWRRNTEEGLPVAESLLDNDYAVDKVQWMKAELLEWAKRFEEAADVFRAAARQPEGATQAARCLAASGNPERGIRLLESTAETHVDHAPVLLLHAAELAAQPNLEQRRQALLRKVIATAPDSPQAATARARLSSATEK